MTARPHSAHRHLGAVAAVAALIAAGFTSVTPIVTDAASATVTPPDGSETFQVSQTTSGASSDPYLTPDGQRVFFTSSATDLVTGDSNGVADVFGSLASADLANPFAGAATRISVPDGSLGVAQANGASGEAVASANGRYVAFSSTATNLVAGGGTTGRTSVYVRDTLLGKTFRVQGAVEPDGTSYDPDLSDDGRLLAFTSTATNLSAGDANGAPDAFLANLDANSDGVLGDIQITRFVGSMVLPGGTEQARISGNGGSIVFVAHQDSLDAADPPSPATGDFVFHGTVVDAAVGYGNLVAANAHSPSIDATGNSFTYIDDDACDSLPTVVAVNVDANYYYAPLGTISTDRRVGYVADPVISADGSHVAWTTTVPAFDFSAPAKELTAPVVRLQEVQWFDSQTTLSCFGLALDWADIADGSQPSLSASARTIAYGAPAPAPNTVFAMDTHSNDGLSVTSTEGSLVTPGFMTSIDIPTIPLTSLRGYSAAIANAPIYHLPIYHLPIRRLPIYHLPIYHLHLSDSPIYHLPIYHLPIYHLPIYHLGYPGGWSDVLADTPFSGELIQSVTLDEVLQWAEKTLAPDSTAEQPQRAAAERIQGLTLEDLGLDGSGLDALSLASYVLGAAPLAQVAIAGSGTPLERWQSLVDEQGLGFTVVDSFYLADLDAAGLDIERSGVDAVPLRSLPIADTFLGDLVMTDLFLAGTPLGALDVSTLDRTAKLALFGNADATGPLASQSFLSGATAADLAAGAPESVTLGVFLMSMLDADSYPWEQISASSFDPNLIESGTSATGCDARLRCAQLAVFQYTFDPGPGEPTTFSAPTASLTTPAGTAPYTIYLSGSGPDRSIIENHPYDGPKQLDGERLQIPLPEAAGGTVYAIRAYFTETTMPGAPKAIGELTSGGLHASAELTGDAPVSSFDDPDHNLVDGVWQGMYPGAMLPSQIYYEWIAPQFRELNDEQQIIQGPAQDEDYYLVDPPPPGKRLIVSTNATDGQISLALYSQGAALSGLGVANAGLAPGTPVTEQSGPDGQSAESGQDAGAELPGQTLVDQAVVGGDGTARVEAAAMDVDPHTPLLVRVTSGNGRPSAALYSLRAQYIDEPGETRCDAYAPNFATDITATGASDPITGATNTVYLVDTRRFTQTYGEPATDQVRAALEGLSNTGHVGSGTVQGAVISVDEDLAVRTARDNLDTNPCSMQARRALSAAINTFVTSKLEGNRDHITSVVIVGGDDIIPLAPVPEQTSQFTEASHAADLRLTKTPAGDPCPEEVDQTSTGIIDPCATPLSAAAAASEILTDDPYGLAQAYESLGGYLYVPTVAVGRLVDSPAQILDTIARFVAAHGLLAGNSSLTGGYGAWSELPADVSSALAWRSSVNVDLGSVRPDGTWSADDIEARLFDAGDSTPRVVSINTHADETRMLPGVLGADSGSFSDTALLLAAGHESSPQLAGSLIFGIGCHAGNNLPTAYYGDVTDWVDVFSQSAGYVGNTGYGLANNVTTALSERLLALYADWTAVTVDGVPVSSAGALMYAKQSYLGGLGLYSGYDEKALMEAVYYGLPMYTFTDPHTKAAPLPPKPPLTIATADGLTSAELTFSPSFAPQTGTNSKGQTVEYLTANGQAPASVPGQPVLPRTVTQLQPAPSGSDLVPRGAILTSITSEFDSTGIPAVVQPGVGVPEAGAMPADLAFPSSFATISHQETPSGPIDLLVVTPAHVEIGPDGKGTTESFTTFDASVVYGPASSSDTTGPRIDLLKVPSLGQGVMNILASDPSGIAAVVLLVQPEGSSTFTRAPVAPPTGDGSHGWEATVPSGPFRWILQIVDSAGNVTTETARGHLDVANAPAPTLGDPGPDVTIAAGARLLRSVPVTDGFQNGGLTASVAVTTADGTLVASSPATVETGEDGKTTRALIDQTLTRSGHFTLTLSVCHRDACSRASFAVDVPAPNAPPAVDVMLVSSNVPAEPTSLLTANVTTSDPENDPITLTYAWTRNGVPIPNQSGTQLALDGIAAPGDVIGVTVTPADATGVGHAASAETLVHVKSVPPPLPTIKAVAKKSGGATYSEGTWSTTQVTVTFTCTTSVPLTSRCPLPVTVKDDTVPTGRVVTGTVTDLLGRSASATVIVKYDAHGPKLDPIVTPATVTVGAPAPVASARATDASSGVASQSCGTTQTTKAGVASVLCQATDVAGNRSTASASYTVVAPVLKTCRGVADRTALAPLNADGSSVFLRSSGAPILFRACDAKGASIATKGFVKSVTLVSRVALPASVKVNELWYPPVPSFTYVKATQLWVGTIPTLPLTGGQKYTYKVLLSDGTSFTVTFGVR